MTAADNPSMYDPDAVVAERTLTRCDTGAAVIVKVFRPVPDPEEPGSTWACGYEIRGLDNVTRERALGSDSMQALMNSLHSIRGALRKAGTEVAWFDAPGWTGFERHHQDPHMEALFENLMQAEIIRQNLLDAQLFGEPLGNVDLMLDHIRKAEEARQRITQRILDRTKKRG